jgi:hypothetical protein
LACSRTLISRTRIARESGPLAERFELHRELRDAVLERRALQDLRVERVLERQQPLVGARVRRARWKLESGSADARRRAVQRLRGRLQEKCDREARSEPGENERQCLQHGGDSAPRALGLPRRRSTA